jgi:hypothetical protein
LRNYIQPIESNAIKNGSVTEELKKWLTWADQKVSWYEPLINEPDPLLNDYHKKNPHQRFLEGMAITI